MKKRLMVLLMASVMTNCNKLDIEEGTTACVEDKIKDFNKSSICDDAQVDEYTFQGNTVYVFFEGNCGADLQTEVVSSDCTSLGYLGGIAGNTKINGAEFSTAIFIENIWKK